LGLGVRAGASNSDNRPATAAAPGSRLACQWERQLAALIEGIPLPDHRPYEPSKRKAMPRPTPQERQQRNERRQRNEAERSAREAPEKQTFARVRSIVDQALSRPRDNFGVDEALIELEEARICALSVFPPQSGAAVAATIAKARLLGLIIDRQKVGSPQDYEFEKARTREELLEMLHERLGPAAVERFKKFVSEIKEIPVVEDRSNGNDEG
jgi:hypothetical protein